MKQANRRNQRQFWLGMFISVVCLIVIFFFIQPGQILSALKNARYDYLALAGLGVAAFLAIRAVRWRFMLNNDAPWQQVFHIQNIGYFLTFLLPFRLGDVARALLIGNIEPPTPTSTPITISRGISTMVVERVLDLLFIIALLPFTLISVELLPTWLQEAARVSGFAAVSAIVILVAAANQRPLATRLATTILDRLTKPGFIPFLHTSQWVARLDNLLAGLNRLTRLRDGFMLIGLSILTWLPILFAYHVGLLAVNLRPTLTMSAFVVCVAAFSVAAPSSPGQIGVFHAGVIAALELAGQPHAEAASFAFLYHALNLLIVTILGLIGMNATGATLSNVIASTRAFMGAASRSSADDPSGR